MKSYQAILSDGSSVDIGEHASLNNAKVWALQQYGPNLSDVIEIPNLVVNHSELDPLWFVVGILGVLLLVSGNKRKKRKRAHVHR